MMQDNDSKQDQECKLHMVPLQYRCDILNKGTFKIYVCFCVSQILFTRRSGGVEALRR